MKHKRHSTRFVYMLLIAFSLLSVSSTFFITFYLKASSVSFYQRQMGETGVYNEYTREYADARMSELLEYLNSGKTLDRQVWNAREINHMSDVKALFETGRAVMLGLIASAAAAGVMLYKLSRKKMIQAIPISAGLIIGFIALILATPFARLFENFHKLLFEPGTYAFDPQTSLMKSLLPNSLFEAFVREWLIGMAIVSGIVIFSYFAIKKQCTDSP